MKKSITFITRNYPPSLNINGESVCDLVDFLQHNYPEIECNVVFIDMHTEHGGRKREPLGNLIKVKNRFDQNFGPMRLFKMLYDGWALVKKTRKVKSDLVVVTTSPPMLPFWAARGLKKGQKRAIWDLDLFPEMLMANGNIKASNPIYKYIVRKTYEDNPDFIIALGPKQAEFITKECYGKDIPVTLLPCGSFDGDPPRDTPEWYNPDKITFGYCGNVNDAHNPDFIRYMIDAIVPEKQQLILALYGSKAPALIEYAQNKPGVILVKSVPREQLIYIDVHMVTLLPGFTHYAVPSKAVSAVTMGKPILFCGSAESDNWAMFHDSGWLVPDDLSKQDRIREFCQSITKTEIAEKENNAAAYSSKLNKMVADSYRFIGEFVSGLQAE